PLGSHRFSSRFQAPHRNSLHPSRRSLQSTPLSRPSLHRSSRSRLLPPNPSLSPSRKRLRRQLQLRRLPKDRPHRPLPPRPIGSFPARFGPIELRYSNPRPSPRSIPSPGFSRPIAPPRSW